MKSEYLEIIDETKPNPLRMHYRKDAAEHKHKHTHVCRPGVLCQTDSIGFASPGGKSPLELVVDASEGFIPLWAKDVVLRWRFQETSMEIFRDPEAAKGYLRQLLAQGMLLWGDASPVKFTEKQDAWDFEIVVNPTDNCNDFGCTLARAFFPDGGRHELVVYPRMFKESMQEQVETMAHEIGHVFGLRHFFAKLNEAAWPAEIFGSKSKFTIMNYGKDSFMTARDRADLTALYDAVWSGRLSKINQTPIRLFHPFSARAFCDQPTQAAAMHMA